MKRVSRDFMAWFMKSYTVHPTKQDCYIDNVCEGVEVTFEGAIQQYKVIQELLKPNRCRTH